MMPNNFKLLQYIFLVILFMTGCEKVLLEPVENDQVQKVL